MKSAQRTLLITNLFYRTNNPIWAYVTIGFTFGPAILAFILGNTFWKGLRDFFLHLPGIQLFPHLYYQYEVLSTDKKAKSCDAKAIKAQSEGRDEEAKELRSKKRPVGITQLRKLMKEADFQWNLYIKYEVTFLREFVRSFSLQPLNGFD